MAPGASFEKLKAVFEKSGLVKTSLQDFVSRFSYGEMAFTSFRVAKGEHPNLIVIGDTPSHQLVWTVFKQMGHQNNISYCPPKISSFVERSIGEEFVLSPNSLLCPHTMGSEQEQKAAHQENYRLWVGREKWIPGLIETGGQ